MPTPVLVLVVEDDQFIQHLLEKQLTEAGFFVIVASTGEEAVAMLDKEGTDYRALITDVNLPERLTGWDVARRAREINATLPVIYATGASAHDWESRGVPNSQLIQKPFAVSQIVTTVLQLVNASANSVLSQIFAELRPGI
jgi:DNA-binding response OmpR family regulator